MSHFFSTKMNENHYSQNISSVPTWHVYSYGASELKLFPFESVTYDARSSEIRSMKYRDISDDIR